MRRLWIFLIAVLALGGSPARAGQVDAINAEGTFVDAASWLYETPEHLYGHTDPIRGTNERIDILGVAPPAGTHFVGLALAPHKMDYHGYPLRISLVDKLFAAQHHVSITKITPDGDGRKYEPGTGVSELPISGPMGPFEYSIHGPAPASGAIPPQFAKAFQYVKDVVATLNLPEAQKDLTHYVVMVVDTSDVTWIELGPEFGSNEVPHLGCQTEMGRDMVFGYEKHPPEGKTGGAFLQCF